MKMAVTSGMNVEEEVDVMMISWVNRQQANSI